MAMQQKQADEKFVNLSLELQNILSIDDPLKDEILSFEIGE